MDGFINVLKPPAMSSGTVVAIVKRVTGEKAGHAGTLDPEACGVLPVMVGRATRLFDYLVEKRKTYLAEIAFGTSTDTQDAQGKVVAKSENYPDSKSVLEILHEFRGVIQQRPPQYSALKIDGETLYKMALKGKTADIPLRPVLVERIDLLAETPRHGMMIRVVCGRGTYIRTICHDIGQRLGCPAHMRFLLREQTGAFFSLDTAVTIEEIKAWKYADALLPMDAPLAHMPRWDVPEALWKACLNGVPIPAQQAPDCACADKNIRLYISGSFIGISSVRTDGTLAPRIVFHQ